jgi:hypothetical protein
MPAETPPVPPAPLPVGGAYTIKNFCLEYDLGTTYAYGLIAAGKLAARKAGKRTLISRESAEAWFNSLPVMEPGATSYGRSRKRSRLRANRCVGSAQ